MNKPTALLSTALFTLLLNPFSYGGEWHSAGNAPTPPSYPQTPVHVQCQVTIFTAKADKTYRIQFDHEFTNEQFQPPGSGVASLTIESEADPGMNGQWFSLAFSPSSSGGENVKLTIGAKIEGQATAFASSTAPREAGRVSGTSSLSLGNAAADSVSSVQVRVDCEL